MDSPVVKRNVLEMSLGCCYLNVVRTTFSEKNQNVEVNLLGI